MPAFLLRFLEISQSVFGWIFGQDPFDKIHHFKDRIDCMNGIIAFQSTVIFLVYHKQLIETGTCQWLEIVHCIDFIS